MVLTGLARSSWRKSGRENETETESDSQYVADDADAPHVGREVDRVELYDLGRHELRRAEHHPRLHARVVVARQTEVDDLDPVSAPTQTQNVLRLLAR